jgi:hypothetical protein
MLYNARSKSRDEMTTPTASEEIYIVVINHGIAKVI